MKPPDQTMNSAAIRAGEAKARSMTRLDALVSWLVLGPIPPLSLALASWWGGVLVGWTDTSIARATFAGAVLGIVVTLTRCRRWAGSLFALGDGALCAVTIFYSVMTYGAMMGMPVLNAAVGAVGGLAVGRRGGLRGDSPPQLRRDAGRWAFFVTLLLALFCGASAVLALRESSIGSELQHMLRLPFVVTQGMVAGLIVVGGLGLLLFQYLAGRLAVLLGAKLPRHLPS